MWGGKLWEAFCVFILTMVALATLGIFVNDED